MRSRSLQNLISVCLLTLGSIIVWVSIVSAQQSSVINSLVRTSASSGVVTDDSVGDWNQYRGPNRDNLSAETGLLDRWPEGGPERVLTVTGLGEGYSSVSLVGNLIYTMGNIGDSEQILAFDRTTGKQVWTTRSGKAYLDGTGNGPRGTPTIIDGRIYTLGGNGDLVCCDAMTGSVVWQKNILQEFGGSNIVWGISESVLIDDGKVICSPGGSAGSVVALDAKSGKTIWVSKVPEAPQASYASPIPMTVGKVKQYVVFTAKGLAGIRASDGEPMWGENASSNGTANCATPLIIGNHVFSSSDYGTGAEYVQLRAQGDAIVSKKLYHTNEMKNHHGGMVFLDGHVYGSSGDLLSCVDVKTGKHTWRERSMKGSIVYADGKLIFRNENGEVVLLAADPKKYSELGKFNQPDRSDRPAWAHPVIAGGHLYLRDQDKLLVYAIR